MGGVVVAAIFVANAIVDGIQDANQVASDLSTAQAISVVVPVSPPDTGTTTDTGATTDVGSGTDAGPVGSGPVTDTLLGWVNKPMLEK